LATINGTLGLRILAYGSVVSTYVLIVIGGYVVFSGSGLACGSSGPDSWPLCNGQLIPNPSSAIYEQALVEWTHRLFTLVVGLFVLGTTLVVWTRYRDEKGVLQLSTASFLILLGQILLGMVTVKTVLNPLVSTAHLAVASALFSAVILNAITVRKFSSSFNVLPR
jgi:heme A synthase